MKCADCSLFSVGINFTGTAMKIVVVPTIHIMLQTLAVAKIMVHFVLNVGKVQKGEKTSESLIE